MGMNDTYLVRLPKEFPLARLACIASEYGYMFRWKQAVNPAYSTYEVVDKDGSIWEPLEAHRVDPT